MNSIIFGPNGSGKGTQAFFLHKRFGVEHIEIGAIFRRHIQHATPIGVRVQQYLEKGQLVPDEITVPMTLEALQGVDPKRGWLLDGFPRNLSQAQSLITALQEHAMKVDYIIEIRLERALAKQRLLGRRVCTHDASHSNNVYIESIAPVNEKCRICNAVLELRKDDADEAIINERHDIYYDTKQGTLAGLHYCVEHLAAMQHTNHIILDGTLPITALEQELIRTMQ